MKYKPTTRAVAARRWPTSSRSPGPRRRKSLTRPLPKKGGRNNQGRITTRHQGGGHKRAYRIIDFRRYDKDGVPAKVARIEYDPNRTARIALLHYADGEKRMSRRRAWSRARRSRPGSARTSNRATTCRCATSPSVPPSTAWSCVRAAARRSPARPAATLSSSPGGLARHAAPAVRRDAVRRRALPRHHR